LLIPTDWSDVIDGIRNVASGEQNDCVKNCCNDEHWDQSILFCDPYGTYEFSKIGVNSDNPTDWISISESSNVLDKNDLTNMYVVGSSVDAMLCAAIERLESSGAASLTLDFYQVYESDFDNPVGSKYDEICALGNTVEWRCLYPVRQDYDVRVDFNIGNSGATFDITIELWNSTTASWHTIATTTEGDVSNGVLPWSVSGDKVSAALNIAQKVAPGWGHINKISGSYVVIDYMPSAEFFEMCLKLDNLGVPLGTCWSAVLGFSRTSSTGSFTDTTGLIPFSTCYSGETYSPTGAPSSSPTTSAPTASSSAPSSPPTTTAPSGSPTTSAPTGTPTKGTTAPTAAPTLAPTTAPTGMPTTSNPTATPTGTPTAYPTITRAPSTTPTVTTSAPSQSPTTSEPSATPTSMPTSSPSGFPSATPTVMPTESPTQFPTTPSPTASPSSPPTRTPSAHPTTPAPVASGVTNPPTGSPTRFPTLPGATGSPTASASPTKSPTRSPSKSATDSPTASPTEAGGSGSGGAAQKGGGDETDVGLIVGAVIGGVVGAALLGAGAYYLYQAMTVAKPEYETGIRLQMT
jgi:hypothetical protein